jgi:hypothetical protein
MKILIFKTPDKQPIEPLSKKCSPWLQKNKSDIDESMVMYIRQNYPDITVDYRNPYKVKDFSKYDMIYYGITYWTPAHLAENKGKKAELKFRKLLSSLPKSKVYLPERYIDFGYDKCKLFKSLSKLGVRMAPTKCFKLSTSNLQIAKQILKEKKSKKWDRIFLKPIPGQESRNILAPGKDIGEKALAKYIKKVQKTKKYDYLVVQQFMPNFATGRYPEIRSYWVGHKFHVGVKTTDQGSYVGNVKRLNPYIKKMGLKVIKYLEKRFHFKFVMARLDWGYDRKMKGYFLNEIEIAPGVFNEEMDYHYGKCTWNLDAHMAERLVKILKDKKKSRSRKR